jgi:hypothetical protein
VGWTQREITELVNRRANGERLEDIAATLGKSFQSVRSKSARTPGCEKITERPASRPVAKSDLAAFARSAGATVSSEWDEEHEDPAQLWSLWEKRNSRTIDKASKRHRFVADFPSRRPVAIAFASDQHIAMGPIDLKRMREDAELIRDTDDLYVVLGGDGVDNHIKIQSAMLAAEGAISDQWLLYNHYLTILRDKVVVMISGNHCDWSKSVCGVDLVNNLARQNKIHYAPSEAIIDARVGGQAYSIGIRHRYKMNSSYNQGHAPKQWMRMGGHDFDVAIVCHHHEAQVESFRWGGKRRWVGRPGSYQVTSSYSKDFGFEDATPTCPTVVFWPDRHRSVMFDDVRDAVWAMRKSA